MDSMSLGVHGLHADEVDSRIKRQPLKAKKGDHYDKDDVELKD